MSHALPHDAATDLVAACFRAHAARIRTLLALRWSERRVATSRLEPGAWPALVRDWLWQYDELVAAAGASAEAASLRDSLVQQTRAAAECEHALEDAGLAFPPAVVARTFALTPVETNLLMFATLLYTDARLGLLVACLRGSTELVAPTIHLGLELFCWHDGERRATVAHLLEGSPLVTERLLAFGRPASARLVVPFLEREFQITPRIAAFLLGGTRHLDTPTSTDAGPVAVRHARIRLDDLVLDMGLRDRVSTAAREPGAHVAVLLRGPSGCGKDALAEALVEQTGAAILDIDFARLVLEHGWADLLVEALSAARLEGAVPVLRLPLGGLEGHGDAGVSLLSELQRTLARWPGLLVWTAGPELSLDDAWLDRPVVAMDLRRPGIAARERIWRQALPRWLRFDGADPVPDAARLPLAPRQIHAVAQQLAGASSQGQGHRTRPPELLGHLCQQALATALQGFGQRIEPKGRFADLVLTPETEIDLREVLARVRHRETVLDTWGFGKRFARGRGLTFLLTGPPGTGKTTAVEIVAAELGQVIYRVDLARLVSKYVGETEKNLGTLFDQAEGSGTILLFDEADSLFSARTSVRTSNDRYANQSVNYLLERIEAYEGVAFLTSNLPDAIDEAFRRRLAMHVAFPEPTADERARLWRSLLPPEAPVDPAIGWDELGRTFQLTGGYIKNAVLRAAVLAAERQSHITHDLLAEAARREYRAMGRLVRAS